MKILLTGVGGPAGICFAKSLKEVPGIALVGANAEADAIGEKFVDTFYTIPFADDPAFLPTLQKIIDTEKVDYLIPLVDEELGIVSANAGDLGCTVVVSPYDTIRHTTDKAKLYDVLHAFLPDRYTHNNATFPLIAKPKIGRGGKGVRIIQNARELAQLDDSVYVFQDVLAAPEVTVDTLFGFSGELVVAIPRIRATVQEGISISGEIVVDAEILGMVREIANRMTFIGPINFQFMRSPIGYKLLEINARSSGGMGITINSGVDIPKMTYEMLRDGDIAHVPSITLGEFRNFDEIIERQRLKSINI